MPADGKKILTRYERLKNDAANHFAFCDRMAPFIAPSRVGILSERVPGQSQTKGVYDSTSLMGAELGANFISSYTMNPAQQWGANRMKNPIFREDHDVNEWLDECRDRQMGIFSDSMFYAEAPESTIDWFGFGTNFLLEEELPSGTVNAPKRGFRGMRFEAQKTGRFLIADGPDGMVDTAMREFRVTADVMLRRWGRDALPPNVSKAISEGKGDTVFTLIHAVYPRDSSEVTYAAGSKKMPFASCWVEKDSKEVVHEGGYKNFPGAVARYQRTPGEVLGRGRGHIAFPDTWTLNQTKRMSLEDFEYKVRPPVLVGHDSIFGTLRLVPGAPTTINTQGMPIRDRVMPFETGSRPEVTALKEEDLRKTIRQIFYVDEILALMEVSKSEMTAFEFSKKLEILFHLLGPVYGRYEREFLRPIWNNTFDYCLEAGVFSPPPPSIFETDGEIEIIFDNPIARAQRALDSQALTQVFQGLTPWAQVFPQIWDNYDPDEIAAIHNRSQGVPVRATRSQSDREQFRSARQAQQEQEQQLEEAGQIAEAAGKTAPLLKVLQGGEGASA